LSRWPLPDPYEPARDENSLDPDDQAEPPNYRYSTPPRFDDLRGSWVGGLRRFLDPPKNDQSSGMATVAEDNNQSGPRKAFSLSRDDALFWIGVAVFGDGLYLLADHPTYAVPLIMAGVALLAWSNRGHMPRPPLRLAALILAMAATCGIAGYDLYDRHFGNPPSVHIATGKLWPPLTDEQEASLERALRALPNHRAFRVICLSADCKEFSGNIISAFYSAGWQPLASYSSTFYSEPVGLVLYLKDTNDRTLTNAIETSTGQKIDRIEASTDPTIESLFVGIKP